MPKTPTHVSTTSVKNVDTANASNGAAAISTVVAACTARARKIRLQSTGWDAKSGVGIVVYDEGDRDHLANIFGFDIKGKAPEQIPYPTRLGKAYARRGSVNGVPTVIWNVEI
jgi:hypothetical protein